MEWLDSSELGWVDWTLFAPVYPVGSFAPATMPVPTCPSGLVAPAMYQYPRGPLSNEFVLTVHECGLGCDSQALVFVPAACFEVLTPVPVYALRIIPESLLMAAQLSAPAYLLRTAPEPPPRTTWIEEPRTLAMHQLRAARLPSQTSVADADATAALQAELA